MTFFTTRRDVYEPYSPPEKDFESLIALLAADTLPDWRVGVWKQRVFTPDGRGAEADLVMLSRSTTDWAVVEVELSRHSISGHVEDQFERIALSRYGPVLAKSVARSLGLEPEECSSHLRGKPSFLCVVDQYSERFRDVCEATGFDLSVMTPFRSRSGHSALRVSVLPRHYRGFVPGTDVILARAPELVFGHAAYLVPGDASLPSGDLRLQVAGDEHVCRQVQVGTVRMLILPASISTDRAPRSLLLKPVDINQAIFAYRGAL